MIGTVFSQSVPDSEQAVLGAILLEPDLLLTANDVIEGADFSSSRHAAVFNAVLDLYQDGQPVEAATVYARLREKGAHEGAGLLLADLHESGVSSEASVRHHAARIRDVAIRRRARRALSALMEEDEDSAEELAGAVERVAIEIGDELGRGRANATVPAILREIRDAREVARANSGIVGVRIAPYRLGEMAPSFSPGHLWMLGGYTSTGKSTLAATLVHDSLDDGAKCVVFSLEDSREEKLLKLLGVRSGISQSVLKSGTFRDWQEERLVGAETDALSWPLLIHDDVYDLDAIRMKARKAKIQLGGLDLIVLDFVQNLHGARGEGIYDRMSRAALVLQRLAKEVGACVLALSQVSNEAMRGGDGVDIIGLKGAGELAAAADVILWIKREKDRQKLTLKVMKNRPWGPTGEVAMKFSDTWTRIEEA